MLESYPIAKQNVLFCGKISLYSLINHRNRIEIDIGYNNKLHLYKTQNIFTIFSDQASLLS